MKVFLKSSTMPVFMENVTRYLAVGNISLKKIYWILQLSIWVEP